MNTKTRFSGAQKPAAANPPVTIVPPAVDSADSDVEHVEAPITPQDGEQSALGAAIAAKEAEAAAEREAMAAEIAKLRADNARLAASSGEGNALTVKVSGKGAISVYGLGRWPVTLYSEQWPRLLDFAPQIRAFVKAQEMHPAVTAARQAKLARKTG